METNFFLLILLLTTTINHSNCMRISQRSLTCPAKINIRQSILKSYDFTSYNNQRIIGGDPSNTNLYDYVVLLASKKEDGNYSFCSAVKIAPRYILSIIPCLQNTSIAFLNFSSAFKPEGETPIKNVFFDARYFSAPVNQRAQYSLTIIELESDTSPPTYMKVSINASLPSTGSYVRVAGYGTQSLTSNVRTSLSQVDVPVYDNDECQEIYGSSNYLLNFDSEICAGYADGKNCSVCFGDYGGPMFQYDSTGDPVVVGITNAYPGLICNLSIPFVGIRTAQYVSNFSEISGVVLTSTVDEIQDGIPLVSPSPFNFEEITQEPLPTDSFPEPTASPITSTSIPPSSDMCPVQINVSQPISRRNLLSNKFTYIDENERIFGGRLSPSSLYDYIVHIATKNEAGNYSSCTAVKIAPGYILSNIGCLEGADTFVAFLNYSTSFTKNGETAVKNVLYDPRYFSSPADQRFQYRLAIIELEIDNSPPNYMKVSINSSLPSQGTFVRLAGFGRLSEDIRGKELRQVDLPIYPNDDCAKVYNDKNFFIFFDTEVCAGYTDGRNCSLCYGDYGGPMIQYDSDGNPVVVAISNVYNDFICDPSVPTIGVRTAQYASNFSTIEGVVTTNTIDESIVSFSTSPSQSDEISFMDFTPVPSISEPIIPVISPSMSTSISFTPSFSQTPSPSFQPSADNLSSGNDDDSSLTTGLAIAVASLAVICVALLIIIGGLAWKFCTGP